VTVLAALALVGCTGSQSGDTGTVTTPTTTSSTVPVDTGWPPGDVGAFQIAHNVNDGTTWAYALATASATNFMNAAECGAQKTTCYPRIDGLDDDTFVTFDPDLGIDRTVTTTRYLGYTLTEGPYTVPYHEDPKTGFGFYAADVSSSPFESGWNPVTWGGQWPEYEGDKQGDLYVPEPIQLLTPATGAFTFTDNSTQTIEWIPTGEGVVTLAVIPKFGDGLFYRLHDDGYFELPANDLGLTTSDVNDITLVLTRWNNLEPTHFGEVTDFTSTSSVTFHGELVNIGTREEIQLPNRCAEAQGALPLEAGTYWGSNRGYTNDLSPSPFTFNSCLYNSYIGNFYANTKGLESIARLEVEPHHQIGVSYNMPAESASVYFVTDCNDENSCFAGADVDPNANVAETISYFNPDQDTKTIYLVLDSTDNKGNVPIWTLDLTDNLLDAPPMEDFCTDAEAAAPVSPGAYYADFVAYTGDLNPGTGGCTGTSLPGPEAIMPIDIPPYGTLNANVNMPGGDPALYLLYDCAQSFTCAGGSDGSLDAAESVVYQNTSLYTQRVYLVVDSKTGLKPFFLSFFY